jgi:hypothetical protein
MQSIARITIHRHESEPASEKSGAVRLGARQQCVSLLYLNRVIGKSPETAAKLCRQPQEAGAPAPALAFTLEDCGPLDAGHFAVCAAARQACKTLRREFHLCGVTAENRALLAEAGLLAGLDAANVHASIALLLERVANDSGQPASGRAAPALADRVDPIRIMGGFRYPVARPLSFG